MREELRKIVEKGRVEEKKREELKKVCKALRTEMRGVVSENEKVGRECEGLREERTVLRVGVKSVVRRWERERGRRTVEGTVRRKEIDEAERVIGELRGRILGLEEGGRRGGMREAALVKEVAGERERRGVVEGEMSDYKRAVQKVIGTDVRREEERIKLLRAGEGADKDVRG